MKWSPYSRSVAQAGLSVGAITASRAEIRERLVDAVDAGEPIDLQRLVVGHAAEVRLRIVRARRHRRGELEDLLAEERHLRLRVARC